jgi:hypothetical protein
LQDKKEHEESGIMKYYVTGTAAYELVNNMPEYWLAAND